MTALEAMSYVRRVGTHCVSLLRSGPEHMTVNCSVSRSDDAIYVPDIGSWSPTWAWMMVHDFVLMKVETLLLLCCLE